MIKKTYLLFLLLSQALTTIPAFSQGSSEDRKGLYDLLESRRKKFEAYSGLLDKKSGFFGNRTKKDVQRSTDVLVEIVETDNRIIGSLNRIIDFRNYQKVNTNYNMLQNDARVNNLQQATDTLEKQLTVLAVSNAALKSKTQKLTWLVFVLSFLLVWILVSAWRKKNTNS